MKKRSFELIIFVFLLVILVAFLFDYFHSKSSRSNSNVKVTVESKQPQNIIVEPTQPIKSLPAGRQEYLISHGSNVKGPKPSKVIIDPLTPAKEQKQTVQATITNDSAVTEAAIILHTDNKQTEYPLTLISGDTLNGTWETSWTMDDSYDYNYYIQFFLKSPTGNFENGLRFRQP